MWIFQAGEANLGDAWYLTIYQNLLTWNAQIDKGSHHSKMQKDGCAKYIRIWHFCFPCIEFDFFAPKYLHLKCFLNEPLLDFFKNVSSKNLGKAAALPALPLVKPLKCSFYNQSHTIRKCKKMAWQNTFKILLLNDTNMIEICVLLRKGTQWPELT